MGHASSLCPSLTHSQCSGNLDWSRFRPQSLEARDQGWCRDAGATRCSGNIGILFCGVPGNLTGWREQSQCSCNGSTEMCTWPDMPNATWMLAVGYLKPKLLNLPRALLFADIAARTQLLSSHWPKLKKRLPHTGSYPDRHRRRSPYYRGHM